MNRALIPSTVIGGDPRASLDDQALLLASRNAYPVVAARPRRSDRAGLLAGGAIALLLGGATFWSMSGQRTPRLPAAARPVAAPLAVPPPLPPSPADVPLDPSAAHSPPQTVPAMTAAPVQGGAMSSPVMVFDMSGARTVAVPPPTAGPQAAALPKAATGQGLGDTESFAARLADAAVETASATRLADPANTITQGTLIAAILETAIDSDLPGYVRAVVSQDVRSFDGSRILIPRSSRLIGQYKSGLAAGQTRAYVLWTRLIRPDGVSIALASPATDYAGRSGLSGEVDGHFGKRFGSAVLLSAVGGLGALASGGASLIVSGGQSAASVAAQRDAQIPPTIRIRQGQPIRIFTARDLDFSTVVEEPAP
jgi:type IV secretion system protein VirB10